MRVGSVNFLVDEIFLFGISGEASGAFVYTENEGFFEVDSVHVQRLNFLSDAGDRVSRLTESDLLTINGICLDLIEKHVMSDGISCDPMVLSAAGETIKNVGAPLPPQIVNELS